MTDELTVDGLVAALRNASMVGSPFIALPNEHQPWTVIDGMFDLEKAVSSFSSVSADREADIERIARIVCRAANYNPDAVATKGTPPAGVSGDWQDGEYMVEWPQWMTFIPHANEIISKESNP